ncbi:hypothetical protein GGR57DRAFT_497369 [Xylariaceae sp. FL1272]|nr:hypothetical protein GGR57DRAFT_497369 [Xylariaceae sp. FL1272]
MSRRLQAGVAGAGIVGLSAASALRRAGLDVEVFERSRFSNEIGAAITVPPNATIWVPVCLDQNTPLANVEKF